MSLSLFLNPYDQRFHLLLRCNYKGRPYFSCRPVQDLHVTRSGGSGTTLHLSRWSVSQRGYKYWAVVHLGTYEGMSGEKTKHSFNVVYELIVFPEIYRTHCIILYHTISQVSRKYPHRAHRG